MAKTRTTTNGKTPKKRLNISESDSSPEKKHCHDTPSRQAAECLSKLRISTPSRNTRSQCNLTETTIGEVMKKRDTNKRQLFPRETRNRTKSPARASARRRKESTSPEAFTIEDSDMEIDENTENISPSRASVSFKPRRKPTTSGENVECYKIRPIILKKVEVIQKDGKEDVVRYRVRTMNTPRAVAKPLAKRNALEDLRSVLHTSEVPENMPCREEEFDTIRKFVIQGVKKNSTSQAMYISGVPGTGKTATTQAVIKEVGKHYKFKYAAVNAMELMEPKQIFVELYKGLGFSIVDGNKKISAVNARKKLNAMFERADKNRQPVIILIDELDMLCTKRQEIFYDVFNWTSCEEARVSVISIANTLDLPERVMNQKITSRLGTNRVVFQPYSYPQIEEIVRSRVSQGSNLVHEQAIEFVSKKVANVSGDLRKAMDLLRRAIEIAVEQGEKKMVRFEHVNLAQKESASAPRNVIGENLSRHEFILFRAALTKVQSSGLEEILFSDLYKQYHVLCTSLEGVNPLNDYATHHLLMHLCSNRFLVASPGMNYPRRKIRLGMPMHDAQFIIKQVEDARKEGRITFV